MGYDSLANYYEPMVSLMQFHHWSPTWLEGLVPWERHLYIDLLTQYVRQENEKQRDRDAANRRK
jgi:hypothetical protein